MKPKWQELASLAQKKIRFFSAVFASKGYPFKNTLNISTKAAHYS